MSSETQTIDITELGEIPADLLAEFERDPLPALEEDSRRAARLDARVRTLAGAVDPRTGRRYVVGESAEWLRVLTQATQVAPTPTTVLLLGESGTGKEVVARFVHRASSRDRGPFVAINCAALPEQLLESELFGHERGAFTGAVQTKTGLIEQAAGGTLFLDEVGEMAPFVQAKLLRVLQEREFQRIGGTRVLRADVRIIAATNRNLEQAIANGQFREDLYYRLNVFAVHLPALRDRRDDILPLADALLTELSRAIGRTSAGLSRGVRRRLVSYHWPGNVRELRNVLERAAILCDGGQVTEDHLPPALLAPVSDRAAQVETGVAFSESPQPFTGDINFVERTMIEEALKNARYNKSKAARAVGLTRHQLYSRLRRHGLA